MTMTMELTHLCVNGRRCVDTVDGHARETDKPNTLCDRCYRRAVKRAEGLTEQYFRLHRAIGDRHAGIDPGIRRPRPGSTTPINVHIATLLHDIHATVTTVAEMLADVLEIDNPEHYPEEKHVAACVKIIAPNLDRLLAMDYLEVMRWNDDGTEHAVASTTGRALLADLDRLASLAHFTLGQVRARTQRDLPCTRCKAKEVGRWAGADDFDCAACGSRFPEDDIRRQDKILLAMTKKGLK